MIHTVTCTETLTITNKTGALYSLTEKDDQIWLENQADEGMVITEKQLFDMLDAFFKKEF